MKAVVSALFLLVSSTQTPAPASPDSAATVRPGIEVFLADVPPALRGKRVGLITNHTGIDRSRTSDIDLIAQHKDLKLVALMAPEHGIRGDAAGRREDRGRQGSQDGRPDLLALQG